MNPTETMIRGYRNNLPEMILGTEWFVTRDEDDPDGRELPMPDKPYLRIFLHEYETNSRLLVPKSRQMLITWCLAAYGLATCLTRKHVLLIYQTKREEDSVGFMNRVHFLYRHLPKDVQECRPANLDNSSKIEFPKQDCRFWGIPQGADIIRGNTVTSLQSDEVNFQPNARATLRAASPSLGKNGVGLWTSSANAGGLMINLIHGDW